MVNKKGFIRTLEAVIAIVLILSLIIYLTPAKELKVGVPSNVLEAREFIFKEILVNEELRDCISNCYIDCSENAICQEKIKSFLGEHIPLGYDYLWEICDFSDKVGCGNYALPEKKAVYSGAVFLSFGGGRVSKTFRLFLYEK